MGHRAQHRTPLDSPTLIHMLTQAYAAAWFAPYHSWFIVPVISGPAAPALAQCLRQKARRALVPAKRLAWRIAALVQQASDQPFKGPDDVRHRDGVLRAVLDAERTSMRTDQQR
jgi:ferritin-like protein